MTAVSDTDHEPDPPSADTGTDTGLSADRDAVSGAGRHEALERLLADNRLSAGAAEAHGIYCGLVAAGAPAAEARWLAELLPEGDGGADLTEARAALADLAAATRARLAGAAMSIDPLLPADDRGLRERATAVHDWNRGFLFGLGLAGVDLGRLSGQAREAIGDLTELTRLDLDDLDDGAANDEALAEVIEYIRVAALLVFEETGAVGGGAH